MNKAFFIGRIANDIEVRYTPTQMASLNLRIAIDRGKDKDGKDRGAPRSSEDRPRPARSSPQRARR